MNSNSDTNMPGTAHTPVVYDDTPLKWEYKNIEIDLDEKQPLGEDALNELGNDGWELVDTVHYQNRLSYYFKRVAQ